MARNNNLLTKNLTKISNACVLTKQEKVAKTSRRLRSLKKEKESVKAALIEAERFAACNDVSIDTVRIFVEVNLKKLELLEHSIAAVAQTMRVEIAELEKAIRKDLILKELET